LGLLLIFYKPAKERDMNPKGDGEGAGEDIKKIQRLKKGILE